MKHRLQTRLLNYFLLIAFAAMLIGIEFYFEMSRADIAAEICNGKLSLEDSLNQDPLGDLRNKIVIMFGVLTIFVAIVLTMFIRNITGPLQRMADVAAQINEGNLSLSVPIETEDEIGEVGNAINELTSNLQEVASMTSTSASDVMEELVDLLAQVDEGRTVDPNRSASVKSSLQSLIEFVDTFTLLKTDIE